MENNTVCVITFGKDDSVHTIVKNRLQAMRYCNKYPEFTWECYNINDVTKKGELK